MRQTLLALSMAAAIAAPTSPAAAQEAGQLVTHVASFGNDADDCSRQAPCRTLNRAIAATARFGTVKVLDSADYGPAVIGKALNLVGEGGKPVLIDPSNGTTGVTALTIRPNMIGDSVTLRNLALDGQGRTSFGIKVPAMQGSLVVSDVVIKNFGVTGLLLNSSNPVRVHASKMEVYNNTYGIAVVAHNSENQLFLENCVSEANRLFSLDVQGPKAIVKARNSGLAVTPVSLAFGGRFVSFGGNMISGSVGPTSTAPLR